MAKRSYDDMVEAFCRAADDWVAHFCNIELRSFPEANHRAFFREAIPVDRSGTYGIYLDGHLVYVGSATVGGLMGTIRHTHSGCGLRNRLLRHRQSIFDSCNIALGQAGFRFLTFDCAELAIALEQRLIRQFRPLWNSVLRGFGTKSSFHGQRTRISAWDSLHFGRFAYSKVEERAQKGLPLWATGQGESPEPMGSNGTRFSRTFLQLAGLPRESLPPLYRTWLQKLDILRASARCRPPLRPAGQSISRTPPGGDTDCPLSRMDKD